MSPLIPAPTPTGRPCALERDPELIERLAAHLETGAPHSMAYGLEAIPERTYYRWLQQGQDEAARLADGEEPDETQELYLRFWQRITQARAKGEHHLWLEMDSAEGHGWQRWAWKLERTRKRTYGQALQVEAEGTATVTAVLLLPPVQQVQDVHPTDTKELDP